MQTKPDPQLPNHVPEPSLRVTLPFAEAAMVLAQEGACQTLPLAAIGSVHAALGIQGGRVGKARLNPAASLLYQLQLNQTITDNCADAIFLTNERGQISFVNPEAERVFGFSSRELVGKNLPEVILSHGSKRCSSNTSDCLLEQLCQSGREVRNLEHRFFHKDGSVLRGVCSKIALGLDRLRVGAVWVIHDLTRERLGEQARQETQQRLIGLIDSAMDAIITVGKDERIMTLNPAAEKVFGYRAGELVGQRLQRILPNGFQASRDAGEKALDRTHPTAAGRRPLGVLTGLRSNGEEFSVEASLSEVELGGRKFFTAILRDITERLQLEEHLRHSQKVEAIGQLAGGVAHDFNNLLTVIAGYTELLLAKTPDTSATRDSLLQIRQASSRAASLTRQLLSFSRKQVPNPKVVNLNALITDTEKMLRRLIGENVLLTTLLAPDLNPVKVDPGQIDQVILNLAVNARDAMPRGGRLTIRTLNIELDEKYARARPEVRPGAYVAVVVNDTGCGIAAHNLSRIFEPFFTTKGVAQGTGLGLAVVQGIIEQGGGHITVQSEPGLGTSFSIYLPAAKGPIHPPPPCPGLTAEAHGRETVLWVEDEEALRSLGSMALQEFGYTILQAADGAEALRIAQEQMVRIDLLMTDVVMPGMSGREVAEALSARRPGLKVLFLSGYTEDEVVRHGVQQTKAAFLQKPFSPTTLAMKVRQVLDSR